MTSTRATLGCAMLVLAACSEAAGTDTVECTNSTHCAAGWMCLDGRCTPPTSADGGSGAPDPDLACEQGAECTAASPCARGTWDCRGTDPQCIVRPASVGTVCRPVAHGCDVQEVCDGIDTSCPADALAEAGTRCVDGTCDGSGGCVAAATTDAAFRTPGTFAWTVPAGCTSLSVSAWGAGGGAGQGVSGSGAGGHAAATFAVTTGTSFVVAVGGPGGDAVGGLGGAGGLHGGGAGGNGISSQAGGGGGGYSGLFVEVQSADRALLVAGGGGGAAGGDVVTVAGAGGGMVGQGATSGATGGAQDAGGFTGGDFGGPTPGTALRGGDGGQQRVGDGGGGGGGGWFGGGGGQGANTDASSGAGGSGYVHVSATDARQQAGSHHIPADADDTTRMGAGDPRAAGAVLLGCAW